MFDSGGAPFFEAAFGTNFFTQKSHICSKMTQQVTHLKVFRKPCKEKIQKLKSVFGLHIRRRIAREPIPKSAQCNPKFFEKTNICKTHFFLLKYEKNQENCLKKVSKWVSSKRGWRPFGHLWRPNLFFDAKSASKRLQK